MKLRGKTWPFLRLHADLQLASMPQSPDRMSFITNILVLYIRYDILSWGYVLDASKLCEQADPDEQSASNQEQSGQLDDDSVRIVGQEENEETTQQHAEAYAH